MTDTKGLKLPLKITEKYGDSNAFYVDVEDASGDCFLSGNEISEIEELQLLVAACNSHRALKEEVERLRLSLSDIKELAANSAWGTDQDEALDTIREWANTALTPDQKVTSPDSEPSRPVQQEKEEDNNV